PDLSARIDGNTIAVQVRVPANHHAYLDAGRDGVLIPISFDWQPLIDAALLRTAPSQVTKPDGSPDDEIGATVLRGAGEFVFETAQADRLDGMSVRVRSQLCNDETGVCYRPTWQEVAL
ncbi:MAG: hypothetical protein KDK34_03095, partial [Leptospiraceae bacterium]|nr:hypothetical protein [Leptospiraceae bacterium]